MVLSYGSERKNVQTKVCSFLEHSWVIISAFKIVIFFNKTSTEIKTKAVDVLLKIINILKELRMAQLCSTNEETLSTSDFPPKNMVFNIPDLIVLIQPESTYIVFIST